MLTDLHTRIHAGNLINWITAHQIAHSYRLRANFAQSEITYSDANTLSKLFMDILYPSVKPISIIFSMRSRDSL